MQQLLAASVDWLWGAEALQPTDWLAKGMEVLRAAIAVCWLDNCQRDQPTDKGATY
jgi:hypothetical protein